jgi:hypothetical protein
MEYIKTVGIKTLIAIFIFPCTAHLPKTKTSILRFPQSYFKNGFFVRKSIIIIKKIAGIFVYSIIRGAFIFADSIQ